MALATLPARRGAGSLVPRTRRQDRKAPSQGYGRRACTQALDRALAVRNRRCRARGRCYEACDLAVSRTPGRTAAEPGCPRERRRCPAWRFATVYTEWCRSPGALRSRMRDSGWDHHPTGCEVGRGCPAGESTLGPCRTKLLTEKPSCEAGHKTAPDQYARPSQPPLQRGGHPHKIVRFRPRSLIRPGT